MQISEYKVHYVVVFYIGPKRSYPSYQRLFRTDPLMLVRTHIDFLRHAGHHISKATFVFNADIDPIIRNKIDNLYGFPIPTDVHYYEGTGYSYGGWNDVIKNNLDQEDYFFLIEDDYIPTTPYFYQPFVDRCTDESPYVCTYVEMKPDGRPCASSSNAIIKAKQCKELFEKHGDVFAELGARDLPSAWHTQLNFLNYLTDAGYKFTDILDEYRTIHMLNCEINHAVSFGNSNAKILIEPIVIPLV